MRPYLGNKNVQWGYFDLENIGEMNFSDEEFEKFRLKQGDLLVCEGGEVGRCAIWDSQINDCCYQKAIHRLRPLNKDIIPAYALEYLFWANTKGLFSSLTGHSTIAHLTAIKLKSLKIPHVPLELQRKFLSQMAAYHVQLDAVIRNKNMLGALMQTFVEAGG